MRVTISEEWEKLMEEDYRKCIESMHKRCKLVIWQRVDLLNIRLL